MPNSAIMGEILAFLQSSLLLSRPSPLFPSRRVHLTGCSRASLAVSSPMCFLSTKPITCPIYFMEQKQRSQIIKARVVSDSKVPITFTVDSAGSGIDILPDSSGSDDNLGGICGNGGGDNGGDGGNNDENEDQSGSHEEKKPVMSMSHKLTLGYAAQVGIGGVMGFVKGGCVKSLIAGGWSTSLLYYVYSVLPLNPVWGSSVGLVLSAALLGVMCSQFKNS